MAISIWSQHHRSRSRSLLRARSSSGCSRRGVENDEHLAFGTIDSWLVWKLTGGVHITDTTNASRTLLFDIRNMRWSDEMCALFNVPMSALPEVRPSSGRFGVTTADLPIPSGVPVSGIAGDQQAALFGQACFAPGQAKNTYGTGSFVLMNVGETCPAPVEGLLTTVAWTLDVAATGRPPTPTRAPSSSPVPRSSGCATASRSSTTPQRPVRWPNPSMTPAAWSSSRHSPASVRPTGMRGSRHDRRHHPRHWPGRTRSGHGRGNGLPNPRCRRRHGEGQRYWRARSPRRRWSVGHGFPAAVPGRPARRALSSDRRLPRRRRSVRPTWPALPRGVGLPADVTENWAADGEFTPTPTGRARCRLRPLAASGRAQPRPGARGLGVEAGQRLGRLRTA